MSTRRQHRLDQGWSILYRKFGSVGQQPPRLRSYLLVTIERVDKRQIQRDRGVDRSAPWQPAP